ncbi:hypothetical protein [Streptomyces wuyuanensis]|uniref:hypothetical protein n=1 Tax=Streptomyces wuyuanensis TaxID=1196353 RepID=UPI0034474715
MIRRPGGAEGFMTGLKERLTQGLARLSVALADGSAGGVTTGKGEPWIAVSGPEPLDEATGLAALLPCRACR